MVDLMMTGVSEVQDRPIVEMPDFDSVYRYNSEMFLDQSKGGHAKWSKMTRDNLREDEWSSSLVYYKVTDEDGDVFGVPTGHTDHTHIKYGLTYGAFLELTSSDAEPYSSELIGLIQTGGIETTTDEWVQVVDSNQDKVIDHEEKEEIYDDEVVDTVIEVDDEQVFTQDIIVQEQEDLPVV